ncbi:Calcineurin-like metallo-phosphoesterase superfamily protein, putative isoform 2 [Hibiscus syriacus]|uniref:Calcineurin-like metallo-phosphoesterase superfamily protein, putative isoform 2 n=1 Tax=Hibiscus syriacus TaxID=106335 RepID=A0A6A3BI11_HIBSY|nr:Calcineurin-like metallo-phosphoesterase superfamily protein, putative isoform 2 [Hibiscus syriacus]
MFSFYMPFLFSCSWPHLSSASSSNFTTNGQRHAADYVKVAVVADPQIMDKTSLRLPPKSLALEVVQFYTDLYMRRAFLSSIRPFKPDVVLFLGDYFDGGPFLSNEEWQESLSRLKHMFGLYSEEIYSNIKVYHLPGNHDIGYASLQSQMPEVVRRYEKEFGSRNYRFMVGEVEFVAVDAQTLDANQEGSFASATWDFHTLGTISWQQGNLYPSFMLLSIRNSSLLDTLKPEEAVLTHLCFLPMQTHIYIWYIILFVLTVLSLVLWPTSGLSFCARVYDMGECVRKSISFTFRHGTKEKNEDENCEYEMIWSADGSMHLVKKVLTQPVVHTNDGGSLERGNAVIRATAKKSVNQQTEVCLNMGTNADSEVDPKKLPPRASKSKVKIVIQRFVRTFRMLILIAAVNIPLYMMLLFKDWIEK